ncbi:MAG: CaiB/BaiF CoA transferase family protein [Parahaliea sp.]
MAGPLHGVRIIEIASIGPGPFCGMMLADHGAEVIRVERPGGPTSGIKRDFAKDILARSRQSIVLDLKQPQGIAIVRDLVRSADGLIEGFRPGVMERLGLGPDVLLKDNPKLVYGRMTGWGQDGPWAQAAGHDINYLALAGALHAFSRPDEKPMPPLNLVGDFGGGGLMLAFGMVSAILHARSGGPGQVIDCAMTDGVAVLMAMIHGLLNMGNWRDERGVNLLDGGAHFYDTYETSDGKFISVGSVEPQFYQLLLQLIGLADDDAFATQMDRAQWPEQKKGIAAVFKTKTRDEWCELLARTDACYAPVLSMTEAVRHPHNVARETYIEVSSSVQPAPAPRYSVTRNDMPEMASQPGSDGDSILRAIGFDEQRITDLRAQGVLA